jgi:hypothetical protein
VSEAALRPADPKQHWITFVRNHATAIMACDFFVVVTATFQLVYVFVIIEVATRPVLTSMSGDMQLRERSLQSPFSPNINC